MRRPLLPLIEGSPDGTWLTVGDGRFGTDANWLQRHGARHVHASDVSDRLLAIGAEREFIGAYSAQNAEALSFGDSEFDFVLCKESFHHFPRPFVALHEMFRVARKGVVLIEPRDVVIDRSPFAGLLDAARWLIGRRDRHGFEPVGNYVYALSERETEKFLLGMHFRFVAFFSLNDACDPAAAFTPASGGSAADRRLRRRMRRKITVFDWLEWLGIRRSRIVLAVLIKEPPGPDMIRGLRDHGWRVKKLPANPYLDSSRSD